MSTDSKYTGKINFLSEKGFGFIKADGADRRVFFHASNCKDTDFSQLFLEQEVIFSKVEENEKGFSAKCVEIK